MEKELEKSWGKMSDARTRRTGLREKENERRKGEREKKNIVT